MGFKHWLLALAFSLSQTLVFAGEEAKPESAEIDTNKTVQVSMETSMGTIELELNGEKAPLSVANFVNYAQTGFYNDTIFHRVINNFMVQGGGFTKDMRRKTTLPAIKNEAKNGLKNDRGTIAMARTSVVDSATSQFFINHKNNGFLNHGGRDYGYAVFGKVTKGMDVVDNIAKVPTARGDVPVETVAILKVTVSQAESQKEAAATAAE